MILFVVAGRMSLLEMGAYAGDWPGAPTLRCLKHMSRNGPCEQHSWESFDPD